MFLWYFYNFVCTFLFVLGCCMQYQFSWGVFCFHFKKKPIPYSHSVSLILKWDLSCHWGYVLFRYKENRRILQEGMKKLGFEEFLGPEHDGYIITSYKYPKDKNFNFKTFYSKLNEKGMLIVSISTCINMNLNNYWNDFYSVEFSLSFMGLWYESWNDIYMSKICWDIMT